MTAAAAELSDSLVGFRKELRWRVVTRTLGFVQRMSRLGYRPDPRGDDWPILGELLAGGRDDCDGWELLNFALLRDAGFAQQEIYRAILRRRDGPGDPGPRAGATSGERYHMVTLWFRDGDASDPFVLDPTAELARNPTRFSRLRDWEPVRLFDESRQFQARRLGEDTTR